MAVEITLPKLSDTMEEGTLLRWLKKEGDEVRAGEVIAEVETDKADMELEADQTGTLSEIRVKEGEEVPVGTVLAVLDGDSRKKKSPPQEAQTPAAHGGNGAEESSAEAADEADSEKSASTGDSDSEDSEDSENAEDGARNAEDSEDGEAGEPSPRRAAPPKVSAAQTEESKAKGTTKPRVVMPPTPKAKVTTKADQATGPQPSTSAAPQKVAKLRMAVAKQMIASKRDIPHFYLTCEIDMTEAAHLRKSLGESPEFPERLTYTHMILRALAVTLPRHPRVNASWSEEGTTFHDAVHLGIAVAVEDGLIAPVLRDCQKRSLRNLARAVAEVVEKVQSGRSEKLTGATFTLSNLGVLDIEEFSAVIIPGQSAILAVGSIKDRPVVRDGQLAVARTMRATLSADHRVSTGYEAGRFLEDLKRVLENPVLLVLGGEETTDTSA